MLFKISYANEDIGANADVKTPVSVFLKAHFCKQLIKTVACHMFAIFAFYPIF